jgi:phosphate transport system protein
MQPILTEPAGVKMKVHLQRDLEHLERGILYIGSLVEQATDKAIQSLANGRTDLAAEVIEGDDEIDTREVELEEDCLKVLALHQPVASDLRYLVSALKVNAMLERMGDLAVNIAQRANALAELPPVQLPFDLMQLASRVREMVRLSLDSMVRTDAELARHVVTLDDEVDEVYHDIFMQLKAGMQRDPAQVEYNLNVLVAVRNLERIADHASGIAQYVVFMAEGEIVRHRII